LYFPQGRRESLEGNKVKKGINATATVGQEIHYKSAGRIISSSSSSSTDR